MSLNNKIIQILSATGVPVSFQRYDGSEPTYITFSEYNQGGKLHADDQEIRSQHSIQVNVWSNGNYISLVKQVKSLLKESGFIRNSEFDDYDEETKTYNKVLRFYFYTKTEEE